MNLPTGTLFNQPDEVHAFVHGFYKSMRTANPRPTAPDSQDELAYWRGGALVADGVQVLAALGVARYGLGWL